MSELREMLYERMRYEFETFVERLKVLPAERIIESAYEKVMKEDILMCFESGNDECFLTEEEIRSLFRSNAPLQECYDEWQKADITYMDRLMDAIKERADSITRARGEKEEDKMTVVLVKPNQRPVVTQIGVSLAAMQEAVGGYIETYTPYNDGAVIICNEDGKTDRLPLNRVIYDDYGNMMDIMAGDFFVCYVPDDGDSFGSLPKDLQEKYMKKFKYPERFHMTPKGISAVKCKPKDREEEMER